MYQTGTATQALFAEHDYSAVRLAGVNTDGSDKACAVTTDELPSSSPTTASDDGTYITHSGYTWVSGSTMLDGDEIMCTTESTVGCCAWKNVSNATLTGCFRCADGTFALNLGGTECSTYVHV